MFYPSASCNVAFPASGEANRDELKLAPTHACASMMPSCVFHCGQTVDMGGVQAQVVGQYGAGFIVAVPANQPVPNAAWITPTYQNALPANNGLMYPMMPGGDALMPAEPNFSACPYPIPSVSTVSSTHEEISLTSQFQEPPAFQVHEADPTAAISLAHNGDGYQNARSKRTDGSTRRSGRQQKQASKLPYQQSSQRNMEGQAAKIFVHDSDGVLHHVAERNQDKSSSEFDVVDGLEEDWSTELTLSSVFSTSLLETPTKVCQDTSLKQILHKDIKAKPPEPTQEEPRRELKGLYAELVNTWNTSRLSKEETNKAPSEASGDGSTTIENSASPDHSANEDDEETSNPVLSRTSSMEQDHLACNRVRTLLADGPPSIPPPAPQEIPEVVEQSEDAVGLDQPRHGRVKGKNVLVTRTDKRALLVTEAHAAPSPAPALPSLPIVVNVPAPKQMAPPQKVVQGRPLQSQKIEKNAEKNEKNSRCTLNRRILAVREEPQQPQRSALEPAQKRQQHIVPMPARAKRGNVDGRSKPTKRNRWAHQKRSMSDFVAAVKARKAKAKKMLSIHGKTFILAVCVAILIFASLACFVGESKAVRTRPTKTTTHSYSSTSPSADLSLGGRRVGAVQEALDFEILRAQAVKEYQRARPTLKPKKTCSIDASKIATYLKKEQQYFMSLAKSDPKLASLLGVVSTKVAKYQDSRYLSRAAHMYRQLMTVRYGSIRTKDTNRIATLMLVLQGMSKCVIGSR